MYAFINSTIHTNTHTLQDYAVIIDNNKIQKIVSLSELPPTINTVDLQGHHLSAGFIDLQLNGCGGVMFNGAETKQTLQIMQAANLKSGTTSFLPTFITASDNGMKQALAVTREYMQQTPNEVLGLHLEGPYICKEKKGIHREEFIRPPDSAMIDYICDNAEFIQQLTLAPENTPVEIIKRLSDAGIVVSIGHSNATYQQATAAIKHGASFATHLFNAMSPMTGREPGVVGAVYDNDIYAGIIADGFHVAYENIRLSKKIMGEKLILVTDATAAAGANINQFDFVGTQVFYKEGKCFGADGTLGGSALTMIEAIENSVKYVGIELDEALRMASLYPAKVIAMDHQLGSIEAGKVANLTIFTDHFKVMGTVVNGIYQPS